MVCVRDVVYVRFAAPDLDLAGRFLADFGFVENARTPLAAFYRCAGENHHVYILERGAPAFRGIGLAVASRADLVALADASGRSIERIEEPGGGERVTLHDPDGTRFDIVHGIEKARASPIRPPLSLNYADRKQRLNALQRPALGPAQMKRLGHVGIVVTDIERMIAWCRATLGMVVSDTVHAGQNTVIAFVRCGYPGIYSDHHALALFQGPKADFGHAAFEVQDFDAVGIGHYHLKRAEWRHAWGIGRHTLGSQIFDYWLDPWGRMIEHFADSDMLDPSVPTGRHSVEDTPIEIWGPPMPAGIGGPESLEERPPR